MILPRELTDEMAEAIALQANCCGGIAHSIYEALVEVAPSDAAWTSVKDALPDEAEACLIFCRDGFRRIGFLDRDDWAFNGKYYDKSFVTHWMYLPDAPSVPKP